MLDPIVNFITRVFHLIGRGIGWLIAWLLWPFMVAGKWYTRRGWIVRAVVGLVILGVLTFYGYFIYQTQHWKGFDPEYPKAIAMASGQALAGEPVEPGSQNTALAQAAPTVSTADTTGLSATGSQTAQAQPQQGQACRRSALVDVSVRLIDLNVNENAWLSSMLANKIGLFGIPWKNTPFLDNKAAFQLGINQVLRRTTTELVDTLGRVRGTSQIDQNLQNARSNLAYPEDAWYFGWNGPTRPSPSLYREAKTELETFNANLEQCRSVFDARADNLLQFVDRIASDIGSTSDILRSRIEASNAGWFDPRADDRFWFAYGQLYAYYGILSATSADFAGIVNDRAVIQIWNRMLEQLRLALDMQPAIISNGNESSAIFPSHLANMGFYLLRVRSNLVEVRSILDR